jgi:hypothetical protein
MAVTATFLKNLNAALKLLTEKFVAKVIKILHSGEDLMLGYAEKDGQT